MLTPAGDVLTGGVKSNPEVIDLLRKADNLTADDVLVVEHLESFGMAVHHGVFETAWWSGRFCEAWMDRGGNVVRIPRKDVKRHLTPEGKNWTRTKDSDIRRWLIELYGGPGQEKKGGRLAGITSHAWEALAVGVTYLDGHTKTFARL